MIIIMKELTYEQIVKVYVYVPVCILHYHSYTFCLITYKYLQSSVRKANAFSYLANLFVHL